MSDEERTPVLPKRRQEDQQASLFIYLVSVLSAIGGFLFGYDTGIVSGALVFIKDAFALDNWWQEFVVSATILAAWIFSLIAGQLTDRWGRKPVIIAASAIFTAGALLMGISWNKFILLVGRFIVGAAIGLASMTVPMYIAEVSPSHIRGKLVTVNNCFITGGQFVASIIAGVFSFDGENGWRYMLAVAAFPGLFQLIGFLFMPESPRWLARQGRFQEAYQVLKTIRKRDSDIDDEFETIKESCITCEREMAQNGGTSVIEQIMQNSSLRRALLLGCVLQMMQQISGINTVMYYSATIIQMSGVRDKTTAVWLASVTAFVNFICTFIGLFLVERIGRRLLTLASLGGVIFSLLVLAVGFQLAAIETPAIGWRDSSTDNTPCSGANNCYDCIRSTSCGFCYIDKNSPLSLEAGNVNGTCLVADSKNHDRASVDHDHICVNGTVGDVVWSYDVCPSQYAIITLFGLVLYLFFFAPGMGPMPWTINSEIYPLWARSTCYSISTGVNWFGNLLVSLTFLSLTQSLTKYGAFYLYAGLAFLGFIFFIFRLPETKGMSLEDVETLFSQDIPICGKRKSVDYVNINGVNVSENGEEANQR